MRFKGKETVWRCQGMFLSSWRWQRIFLYLHACRGSSMGARLSGGKESVIRTLPPVALWVQSVIIRGRRGGCPIPGRGRRKDIALDKRGR